MADNDLMRTYDRAFQRYRRHMCTAKRESGLRATAELAKARTALNEIARLRTTVIRPAPEPNGASGADHPGPTRGSD